MMGSCKIETPALYRVCLKFYLFMFSILLFTMLQNICTHPCGIEFLKKPKRLLVKNEGEDLRHLKSEEWAPLRIHLDFSNIENNLGKFSKDDYLDLKDKIMPKTKEILEKLLKVKRSKKNLKLPYEKCDIIQISEKYLSEGEGVDADIIIFVAIDDSGWFIKNKVEAAAIHCFQDNDSRRPISGYIQFKPDLKIKNSTAVDYMVWLAIHEITHILVMNDSLYDDWLDSNMQPFGFDSVVGKKILPNGKSMSYIKTPKILEKGRAHFGCSSFEGLPLEYNGGSGTVGAHWSKKYMNTDYMIGDSYGENLISELSLAMFEDSGWYKVDYSQANLFIWGKNKGCDFLDHKIKCVEKKENKIVSRFNNEFCTSLNYPVCSTSNIFRALCKTKKYENLSPHEKYFGDNTAGIDSLCDKCPIPIEVKNGISYYGGSCRAGDTRNLSKFEKVCHNCACFTSNLRENPQKNNSTSKKNYLRLRFKQDDLSAKSTISINTESSRKKSETENHNEINELTYKANCLEFKCDNSQLHVIIDKKSYKCDKEKIEIEGYEGFINCPSSDILCNKKFRCKFGCAENYE